MATILQMLRPEAESHARMALGSMNPLPSPFCPMDERYILGRPEYSDPATRSEAMEDLVVGLSGYSTARQFYTAHLAALNRLIDPKQIAFPANIRFGESTQTAFIIHKALDGYSPQQTTPGVTHIQLIINIPEAAFLVFARGFSVPGPAQLPDDVINAYPKLGALLLVERIDDSYQLHPLIRVDILRALVPSEGQLVESPPIFTTTTAKELNRLPDEAFVAANINQRIYEGF